MRENRTKNLPPIYPIIQEKCLEIGFNMPSDILIGTMLKSLVASKRGGSFLELGTGIGLSLAWMVDGMDNASQLISIDNDPSLSKIVSEWFRLDPRVNILCHDGSDWLKNYSGELFDLIFADTWPGKYYELEETLALLKIGGFYIIDDMNSLPNWPEGHAEKAKTLIGKLESMKDFTFTQLDWSTGVILMCKIS
jgi:predicted O-methyltransferase YrrM